MDRSEFERYLQAYSDGDLSVVEHYYAPDIIFESFGQRRSGPDVMHFLQQVNADVQTCIRPLTILMDDSHVALQAEMDMLARRDLPHLPAGAMRAGERRTCHLLGFYTLSDGHITHVQLAGWPKTE